MIIFLGAGASRTFGIPTMPEFVDIFDKEIGDYWLYKEVKNSFDKESFDLEVLMTVLEDLSKDKKELFSRISPQTSTFLWRIMREKGTEYADTFLVPDTENMAKECLSKIKRIIRRECFNAVRNNAGTIVRVYDDLFSLLSSVKEPLKMKRIGSFSHAGDGRLTYPTNLEIFTTNYDTCIETYLNKHQIQSKVGVSPRYGNIVFDVDSYDGRENARVEVFKLHGSVDLFRKGGEIRQFTGFPRETGVTHLGEEFGEEHMRFPIEFGGYHHIIESPYLDLFRLFRDRMKLDVQTLWLLIGSDFRDITICSIINDVLRLKDSGEHPLIILVNPNAETIIKRLREWGMNTFAERIVKVEEKFGTRECIAELDVTLRTHNQSP